MSKAINKRFFEIEKQRVELAKQGKYLKLVKMYGSKFPEIKNTNTAKFWDKKLSLLQPLSGKDGLTNARVKCAYNFLQNSAIKVLDIGAGQGYLEELLEKRNGLKIYSNDFSKRGVELLKKRFKGVFEVMSVYNLKYPKKSFDAVFALELLEHIPPSKIFSVLRSIHGLITKNGYFIVSVPINEHLEKMNENPNGHLRDYKKELIIAELELSGFMIVDFRCFSAFRMLYGFKTLLQKTILKKRWEYNDVVIKAQKV